jgi:hypothetical protein
MRLNATALSNYPPRFGARLGKFCDPFHNLLIESTGKPLASRYSLTSRGVFSDRIFASSVDRLESPAPD